MKHGIFIQEEATALTVPITGNSSVQVVIGAAPINMAENPAELVNVPILANSATEAKAALGYSNKMAKGEYTLCQTMYATSNLFVVSPVVYINVLDPAKHKKSLAESQYPVINKQATINVEGVLRDSLTVKNSTGAVALTEGTDYSAEFNEDGHLVLTMIAGGKGISATSLTVSGNILDPSMIKK